MCEYGFQDGGGVNDEKAAEVGGFHYGDKVVCGSHAEGDEVADLVFWGDCLSAGGFYSLGEFFAFCEGVEAGMEGEGVAAADEAGYGEVVA